MKKIILSLLILSISILPAFSEIEIKLNTTKRQGLLIERNDSLVYKPTKLIIGEKTKFIIKGNPGNYATLFVSLSEDSLKSINNKKLNIDSSITAKEEVIPTNGILELAYETPNDKTLIGKAMFFQVIISKNKADEKFQIAQIISPKGIETTLNGIEICMPAKDISRPGFTPNIPGFSPEVSKAIDAIEKIKNNENLEYTDDYYDPNTPDIIKNLRAPDLYK